MAQDLPIACSLGSNELEERLAEVARIGSDALLSASRDGVLRFRADRPTRERLEAVVAAEAECCAFLTFDLREEAGVLVLAVAGPPGAEPVVAELVDAFAG
jgi:hypothetical protein